MACECSMCSEMDDCGADCAQDDSADESLLQNDCHNFKLRERRNSRNLVHKLFNREIYGRVTTNSRSRTKPFFENVHHKCQYRLDELFGNDIIDHIFMGFTICGKYFITYKEKTGEMVDGDNAYYGTEHELFIWLFVPGEHLKFIAQHRIFKLLQGNSLEEITMIQYPTDPYKLYCFGLEFICPAMAYLTILTLPIDTNCITCRESGVGNNTGPYQTPLDGGLSSSMMLMTTPSWCSRHGFMLHYMFSMAQPIPDFDPKVSFAYPDHAVINTGHCVHILHVAAVLQQRTCIPLAASQTPPQLDQSCMVGNGVPADGIISNVIPSVVQGINSSMASDNCSEASELSGAEALSVGSTSVVDAIIEDFNEYDLEGTDGNKPFHELNISCEPLNLTGRSYPSTIGKPSLQEPRLMRLQGGFYSMSTATTASISTTDKFKVAEKAYEFTEETEKCEKLSSFRKRRLAEKKYEFSEDNTENIVLSTHCGVRAAAVSITATAALPKVAGWIPITTFTHAKFVWWTLADAIAKLTLRHRSVQPTHHQRYGRIYPYCPSPSSTSLFRTSPYHHAHRASISPRDNGSGGLGSIAGSSGSGSGARRFHVYSPSLDSSDCPDPDSKMVLRQINNFQEFRGTPPNVTVQSQHIATGGLLIIDGGKSLGGMALNGCMTAAQIETPRWIRKVVKRYSSSDFETSSLVSGHSRDDYNIPIEIPLIVQTLGDQQLEVVSEFRTESAMQGMQETQLLVTQRTLDIEQFVQQRAHKLCADVQLQFLHCEDYDIKLLDVCPLSGQTLSQVSITICALRLNEQHARPQLYTAHCVLAWSIETDAFEVIEMNEPDPEGGLGRLRRYQKYLASKELRGKPTYSIPRDLPQVERAPLWILAYEMHSSKRVLSDYRGLYQIDIDSIHSSADNYSSALSMTYGGSDESRESFDS